MGTITYKTDAAFELDQMIELYHASTLAERRPVGNRAVMQGMMDNADLIVTAWHGDQLVGISRTLSDHVYVAYLADLAVHLDYQKQGIGRALVAETRKVLAPTCFLTLLSAPASNDFYPNIGFEHHPRAWFVEPEVDPTSCQS